MARSRNIKPGFFLNDELAEIEPLGRLLFAGLWTIADKEGRLEDRPKKIKAAVLPYDNCDVNKLLNDLNNKHFITRYEVGNERFIAINNWDKHQNPHVKESPSTIPEPKTGAPYLHCTSMVQEPDKHRTNPADSLNLIPDSLNPIYIVNFDEVVSRFHSNCPSLPKIKKVTEKRKRLIKTRLSQYSLDELAEAFTKAEASDFLSGRSGKWTGCNFDWLMNEGNLVKVLEGNYDNKKVANSTEPEKEAYYKQLLGD